jgi:hypothetical protein
VPITTENAELKSFRIRPKVAKPFTIKAHSMGKIMEGMIFFHAQDGSVVAAFTTAELIGFFELESFIKE